MVVGPSGNLLFVTDTDSGRRFLCDTGAQVSVLPASNLDVQQGGRGLALEAANGSPIQTFGKRDAVVCFGGQRFKWDFVVAKVSTPLLGADGLLVDVRNQRLINTETFNSLPCVLSGSSSSRLSSALSASDDFSCLLAEFPILTRPTFSSATAKHGVEHYITATGPPVYARARRLEPGKLAVAKAEFGEPGHRSTLQQPIDLTSTHCAEAWQRMAPVWGLPSPQ